MSYGYEGVLILCFLCCWCGDSSMQLSPYVYVLLMCNNVSYPMLSLKVLRLAWCNFSELLKFALLKSFGG